MYNTKPPLLYTLSFQSEGFILGLLPFLLVYLVYLTPCLHVPVVDSINFRKAVSVDAMSRQLASSQVVLTLIESVDSDAFTASFQMTVWI